MCRENVSQKMNVPLQLLWIVKSSWSLLCSLWLSCGIHQLIRSWQQLTYSYGKEIIIEQLPVAQSLYVHGLYHKKMREYYFPSCKKSWLSLLLWKQYTHSVKPSEIFSYKFCDGIFSSFQSFWLDHWRADGERVQEAEAQMKKLVARTPWILKHPESEITQSTCKNSGAAHHCFCKLLPVTEGSKGCWLDTI